TRPARTGSREMFGCMPLLCCIAAISSLPARRDTREFWESRCFGCSAPHLQASRIVLIRPSVQSLADSEITHFAAGSPIHHRHTSPNTPHSSQPKSICNDRYLDLSIRYSCFIFFLYH